MVRRAVLGLALFGMMGTVAFGQTMLNARSTDGRGPGEFAPGETATIEFFLTDLTPVNSALPSLLNWQLDFIADNAEDGALSYGKFTQTIVVNPFTGEEVITREFWDFQTGPLFPASGGPFQLFVEDPLPAVGGVEGPDNRGSSRRDPPAPGPGWSVQQPPITQVFVGDMNGPFAEVLLATFEIKIDDNGDDTNTILGGGGPFAQLEWVTELDALFAPSDTALEDGFGLTVGGLIGQALVPEPATMALLIAGLGGGLVARRRRS